MNVSMSTPSDTSASTETSSTSLLSRRSRRPVTETQPPRNCDSIGRFGGDEFIAILRGTSKLHAHRLAKGLRSSIATKIIPATDKPLTASVGVAQWAADMTAEQVLAHADQAMLLAKAPRQEHATPGRPARQKGLG